MAFEIFRSIKYARTATKQQRRNAVLFLCRLLYPLDFGFQFKECENNRLQQLKDYLFKKEVRSIPYGSKVSFVEYKDF